MATANRWQADDRRRDRRARRRSTPSPSGPRRRAVDPIPVARARGHLFLDAGGQALHRLQQPADVREHRPRRPARRQGDSGAGGDAGLCDTVDDHRAARAARREAGGSSRRAISTSSSSPTAAPRPTRTRSRSRAPTPAGRRFWRATARTTAARPPRLQRPASREAGVRRRCRASCTCWIPYHGIERGWDSADASLRYLEEVIQLEGPQTIAAFILESVTGTNGILVPPDGYMQGVRALCDKYGILMIADEVMSGFGRTGKWFADRALGRRARHDHDGEGADQRLRAARRRRRAAARSPIISRTSRFPGGLTYSSHPARLRRGAGDDRGLRRGRPDRARADAPAR